MQSMMRADLVGVPTIGSIRPSAPMSQARAMWWYPSMARGRSPAGRRLEIADGALDRLDREAGMLDVENHELAAGRFQDMADARRGELDDEMPELQLAHVRVSALRPWPFTAFLPMAFRSLAGILGQVSMEGVGRRQCWGGRQIGR